MTGSAGYPLPAWTGRAGLLALRDRVATWLLRTDWVQAALLFGSTERTDRPADEWSDLDVLIVADDDGTIEDAVWPAQLGQVWISLVHDAPIPGIRVRQVLYAPGHDVDWVPVTWAMLERIPDEAWDDIAGAGARVIKDPSGRLAAAVARGRVGGQAAAPPTEAAFTWMVDDFLYQTVWAVKRLLRGELWRAKDDVDHYLKQHLLTMLAWHALALDPDAMVHPEGRRLDRWADPTALGRLPDAFARYEVADVARAAGENLALFGDLAKVVARHHGWGYPADRELDIERWVTARLTEHRLR